MNGSQRRQSDVCILHVVTPFLLQHCETWTSDKDRWSEGKIKYEHNIVSLTRELSCGALNPKSHKPQTLTPKPETLNPKP